MKMIVLATAAWIANPFAVPGGSLGDVRSPADGPQTVDDDVAEELEAQGLLAEEPVGLPDYDDAAPIEAEEPAPPPKRGRTARAAI